MFFKLPHIVIVNHNKIYDLLEKKNKFKTTKNNKTRYVSLDFKCSIFTYLYLKNIKEEKLFNFNPYQLTSDFHKVIVKANLKKQQRIRFHDLRHIHASYILAHNKNKANTLKALQHRLGHSDIQTTLNTYAHIINNEQGKIVKPLNFM